MIDFKESLFLRKMRQVTPIGDDTAALLAAQILALSDDELAEKLIAKREADAKAVLEKDAAIAAEYNK